MGQWLALVYALIVAAPCLWLALALAVERPEAVRALVAWWW